MIVRGDNLGVKDVKLNRLTSYNWSEDIQIINVIKLIEDMYFSLCSKNTYVNLMDTDDEGRIIIKKGMINHKCCKEIDSLRNISQYGILSSEWFGELESEREGCFCTFISKTKGDNYLGGKGDLAEDDKSRLNVGKNVLLFFDDSNEIMQMLLHLDYFEYVYRKTKDLNNISNIYTPDEIRILDFIESLSPAGKDMRKQYDFKTNYWIAIPSGIPSFLVNGICIKKNKYSDEELNEISRLFPNATIFNNERRIIKQPLIIKQQNRTK